MFWHKLKLGHLIRILAISKWSDFCTVQLHGKLTLSFSSLMVSDVWRTSMTPWKGIYFHSLVPDLFVLFKPCLARRGMIAQTVQVPGCVLCFLGLVRSLASRVGIWTDHSIYSVLVDFYSKHLLWNIQSRTDELIFYQTFWQNIELFLFMADLNLVQCFGLTKMQHFL